MVYGYPETSEPPTFEANLFHSVFSSFSFGSLKRIACVGVQVSVHSESESYGLAGGKNCQWKAFHFRTVCLTHTCATTIAAAAYVYAMYVERTPIESAFVCFHPVAASKCACLYIMYEGENIFLPHSMHTTRRHLYNKHRPCHSEW